MTSAFRYHDHYPPRVTSPLYRSLIQEWIQLNAVRSTQTTIRMWAPREPALAGYDRPGDLVDAVDDADDDGADLMLLALIRLAQDGQQLAGRILLQVLLPQLGGMTRRVRLKLPPSVTFGGGGWRIAAWYEEREHITVSEFWDLLTTYPVQRRTHNVRAQLTLDTLSRLTRQRDRMQQVVENETSNARVTSTGCLNPGFGYDFDEADEEENPLVGPGLHADWTRRTHRQIPAGNDSQVVDLVEGEVRQEADLPDVLEWARRLDVITSQDATLLARVYMDRPDGKPVASDAVAAELGIRPAALRQRCSRARARLTEAVQDHRAAAATRAALSA